MNGDLAMPARGSNPRATKKGRRLKAASPAVSPTCHAPVLPNDGHHLPPQTHPQAEPA